MLHCASGGDQKAVTTKKLKTEWSRIIHARGVGEGGTWGTVAQWLVHAPRYEPADLSWTPGPRLASVTVASEILTGSDPCPPPHLLLSLKPRCDQSGEVWQNHNTP